MADDIILMLHILKSKDVYVGLIEVKPLAGCELNPLEFIGAAVRVYIPAVSQENAQALLQDSLRENYFALIEVEFLVEENSVEWENPDDPIAKFLAEEALKYNDVIYGEFRAWSDDG